MESDGPSSVPNASNPRLPSPGGPASRLSDHAKSLSGDVRAWLELRYKLAKIELFEKLNEQADQLIVYAIVASLAAVGGLVMLLAVCFLVSWIISAITGWLLGALFLGFFLVASFFFVCAAGFFFTKPKFGPLKSRTRATIAESKVMPSPTDTRRRGSSARASSARASSAPAAQ